MADQRHAQIFRWLGLPPGNWPPDLYTLLGLVRGETNPRKIEQAAERRLAMLRPYQVKYADLASEAMNAVASALVTLTSKVGQTSPERAAAQQTASAASGAPATAAVPPGPAPRRRDDLPRPCPRCRLRPRLACQWAQAAFRPLRRRVRPFVAFRPRCRRRHRFRRALALRRPCRRRPWRGVGAGQRPYLYRSLVRCPWQSS